MLTGLSHAQNWCPPGATWTYYMQASWGEGYYDLLYAGDTLLGGELGQKIYSSSNFYYVDIGTVMVDPPQYYITTRRDTDMVWWWEPDLMVWDTLYNFGAIPGDRWLPRTSLEYVRRMSGSKWSTQAGSS
ncbi:MAG: hypothetical protein IPK70_17275 [Flavobacteriales bacterium]|nr:hypothetical protein [Flavobacteriales bacterium]